MRELAKWASEWTSERSGGRERSEQSGASKRVNGASERVNGRASSPVLTSLFLFVRDESAMVGGVIRWYWWLNWKAFRFISSFSLTGHVSNRNDDWRRSASFSVSSACPISFSSSYSSSFSFSSYSSSSSFSSFPPTVSIGNLIVHLVLISNDFFL